MMEFNEELHEKELKKTASQLKSFGFDSVRIITTIDNGAETISMHHGIGNFYAQYGAVKEWVIRQEEYTKQNARQEDDD